MATVIDATEIIEDYRRLSCSVEKLLFNFNFFWIFFATPDRAQREQQIGGLKKCVRARVRSAWRVEVYMIFESANFRMFSSITEPGAAFEHLKQRFGGFSRGAAKPKT